MGVTVGQELEQEEEVMAAINTTPLVDVMLVLLIIFLITIPVVTHTIQLSLPKETNLAVATKPENINLSIDFDGSIYWNENGVNRNDLLNYVLQEAVKDETVKKRFADLGAEAYPPEKATPAALAAHVKAEIDKWAPIIKKAGIYAD